VADRAGPRHRAREQHGLEIFLIDGLAGEGRLVDRLDKAWGWGTEKPRRPIGYPMPRADSHCWFMLTGEHAPAMFAKICGVDLRLHKFQQGASAEYMWTCLVDAMAEFGGRPIGWSALKRLAGLP
jgi:sarcosine oxidase subunit gamma